MVEAETERAAAEVETEQAPAEVDRLPMTVQVGTFVVSAAGKQQVGGYFQATEVRMTEWNAGGSDSDQYQPYTYLLEEQVVGLIVGFHGCLGSLVVVVEVGVGFDRWIEQVDFR